MATKSKEAILKFIEAYINGKEEESEIAFHEAFKFKSQAVLEKKDEDDMDDKDVEKDDEDDMDDEDVEKDEEDDEEDDDEDDKECDDEDDDEKDVKESFKAPKPKGKMLPKHKSGFKPLKKVVKKK